MAELRKYGVQTDIYFPLIDAGTNNFATSSDYTHSSGDVKISKDGGAAATATNSPSAITMGNGAMWKLTITATEMQAAKVVVTIIDAATKAIEDQMILIDTYGNASAEHAVDLDDSVRAGLTALPNAAADAAGGLPISDAGGLDLDAKIGALTFTVAGDVDVNVQSWGGSSIATPTTAGVPEVDVTYFGGTLATTAGGRPEVTLGNLGHGGAAATLQVATLTVGASAGAAALATGADLATVAGYLDTEIAAILEDTGTTLPATLGTLATSSALATAQADLDTLTGADGATLATSQPNYAPATAASLATVATNVTNIETDTQDIQSRLPAALVNSRMDCTIDATGMEAGAVDAIIDEVIEGSTTMRQMLRGFAAALLAKCSGLPTSPVFRDVGDSKDRITATTDADGNRSAVTLDLT